MACDTVGVKQIRCFCFKFWGIVWIGWVLERHLDPTPLYYDDTPYVIMHSAEDIHYATIGFTRNSVMKRLQKYVDRAEV